MPQNEFVHQSELSASDRKALALATPGVASAAKWFWWIAGLSLVNTVLIHSGSETSFVVGLGFTLIADAVFQNLKPVAFAIDAVAIGFFFAMGLFALRGYRWAFAVGAVFYLFDAIIYLIFQDLMPLAFHAFALFFIVGGGLRLHAAIKEQAANQKTPNQALQTTPSTSSGG